MIDIKPTTRLVFWDAEVEKLWRPRIERVKKVYSDAELATMLTGMRRVYVYHVNSTRFEQSYPFLRKNKLVFFPTNKSGVYGGFSHKHQPLKEGEPYILYGAAVKANDEEAGELFTQYSGSPTDHAGIGELLGYMKCCTEFFLKNWPDVSVDPMYEAAINTEGMEWEVHDWIGMNHPTDSGMEHTVKVDCHPYCNNMLRYFGIRITPHLTCSLKCEETIKWGEEWIEVMKQIDEEATDWAIELLSMPLTWNCYKGVAVIDTPIFRGVTNSDVTLVKKIVTKKGWKD